MKKLLSRSLGALALLMLVSACRSSSLPELETKLERQGSSDTLALVTYIGQPQYTDSLLHYDAALSLSPDTSRYHAVLISHAGGQRLRYYALAGAGAASSGRPAQPHGGAALLRARHRGARA